MYTSPKYGGSALEALMCGICSTKQYHTEILWKNITWQSGPEMA